MTLDKALDLRLRPLPKRLAKPLLRVGDARMPGGLGVAARQKRLRVVIERAQKLALPSIPGGGPNRANIGDGQQQQKLEPFGALHEIGEILAPFAGRKYRGFAPSGSSQGGS